MQRRLPNHTLVDLHSIMCIPKHFCLISFVPKRLQSSPPAYAHVYASPSACPCSNTLQICTAAFLPRHIFDLKHAFSPALKLFTLSNSHGSARMTPQDSFHFTILLVYVLTLLRNCALTLLCYSSCELRRFLSPEQLCSCATELF